MHKQRGVTFIGLVFMIATLMFVVVMGMKLTPAYLEYFSVKKAITKLSNEPTFAAMSKKDIVDEFDRSATIDDIKVVSGKDLEVSKDDAGKPVVSIEYQTTVPLIANVSALINFSASTESARPSKQAATLDAQ
jgi:hypothetical protein